MYINKVGIRWTGLPYRKFESLFIYFTGKKEQICFSLILCIEAEIFLYMHLFWIIICRILIMQLSRIQSESETSPYVTSDAIQWVGRREIWTLNLVCGHTRQPHTAAIGNNRQQPATTAEWAAETVSGCRSPVWARCKPFIAASCRSFSPRKRDLNFV